MCPERDISVHEEDSRCLDVRGELSRYTLTAFTELRIPLLCNFPLKFVFLLRVTWLQLPIIDTWFPRGNKLISLDSHFSIPQSVCDRFYIQFRDVKAENYVSGELPVLRPRAAFVLGLRGELQSICPVMFINTDPPFVAFPWLMLRVKCGFFCFVCFCNLELVLSVHVVQPLFLSSQTHITKRCGGVTFFSCHNIFQF